MGRGFAAVTNTETLSRALKEPSFDLSSYLESEMQEKLVGV